MGSRGNEVDLESTRTTVKLFAGESGLGLKRIEEDSWTAPQARHATSKMQQWRGYTFFKIKEEKERQSPGMQEEVVKEKASSLSARARTWEVGYVKGGPVERGAEAGLVAFFPKTGSEPDPPQEETSESLEWEQV